MAEKMIPKNYQNMITALNNFAAKTVETTSELQSACTACSQVLGADDLAAQGMVSHASAISNRYAELAKSAQLIARAMQDELDEYYGNEDGNWKETEPASDGGDDF